jgi:pimeloyl-ACP methyl ester carboxylesterase
MTTSPTTWTQEKATVAGAELQYLKDGSGEPLLVLHGEMGQPGWLNYHEELAKRYTVYAPRHPGFGVTPRLEWIMNMRDFASWYLRAMEELGLANSNVLGFSMGGWLAAEMAAQSPGNFKKLELVAPPGIRPPEGDIMDMFLMTSKDFVNAGILNPAATSEFETICPEEPTPEQIDLWEDAREEACRLSWRPYMHDPALPHLLRLVKDLQTLIVWGDQDPVVPPSAGTAYNQAIAGSKLVTIPNCGHHPEIEKTAEFLKATREFFG